MLQKIKGLIRELGFLNTILHLTNYFFLRFKIPFRVFKYYFVAQRLYEKSLLPDRRGRNIGISDIPSKVKPHPCPRPNAVIIDRYQQGAVCLGAYKEHEFAGCFWYITDKYKEDEVNCLYKLANIDSAWDFDVYVVPKFRMSPVFLKLWDDASKHLIEQGIHWSLSRISAFNARSISSHLRMGAQLVGWACFICTGSFQLTIASIFPFLHISFNKSSYPVFILMPPKN
ncbi:conserved hypothetical protein [Candidatus Methylobacter favarea]|uniref:Uncharacterized protein n=1 Tax=Candidatus Methylobacter favarea TaxID=2707345 RepID=A0A8S0XGZ8_9GAMM|nr:N-acetyltransferase [Candidatus Methylobacter favarea]CAA9889311.1 conserved hypothetical protein [Candidatus Methylobacter favarea]